MNIRRATIHDLDLVTEIEAACFLPAEAAPRKSFEARLQIFPDYFWILEEEGNARGFINGPVINQNIIDDEMYAEANCHRQDGEWQTVFGINTLPEYRKQGLGKVMIEAVIECARREGRKGCVLTCKDYLLPFYESMGFRSMGISASTHGGASWNDMILEF
ncbi:MAG: GNAT family N-acetyltransferase [Eubacteriales bacterium]